MNPYWQFLENSSRFFEIFSFPGHEPDRITGKLVHFSKFEFQDHELDRFAYPYLSFIIFRLNSLCWISFPTRANPGKLIQFFSKISFLRVTSGTVLLENSSIFSKYQLWVHKLDHFTGKLIHQNFKSTFSGFGKYQIMS